MIINLKATQRYQEEPIARNDRYTWDLVVPGAPEGMSVIQPFMNLYYHLPLDHWIPYSDATTPTPSKSSLVDPSQYLFEDGGVPNNSRWSGQMIRDWLTAKLGGQG